MKITIIYPDIRKDLPQYTGNYSEGLAMLSAVAKAAGHQVRFIHLTMPTSEDRLISLIGDKDYPEIIAFSSVSNKYQYVKEMALWVKRHFNVPIIYGGVHPTLNPEEAINTDGIDFICVGEGEEALLEFLKNLERGNDITHIPNIWSKQGHKITRNSPRPMIENLDELPLPDRSIFDFENLMSSKDGEAHFIASRGCPYLCTYCANHALRSIYPNKDKYVRFKSVDKILEEVQETIDKMPFIKYVFFEDDILPLKISWFEEFSEKYHKKIGLPFHCNMHPGLVNKRVVSLLAKAGCKAVSLGVESGNERIRYEILSRKVSDKQIIDATKLLRANGIKIATFNMVGLPYEGMQEVIETAKLNAKIKPTHAYSTIFYPYSGTELLAFCKEKGLLTSKSYDTYSEGTILSQGTITNEQVVFAHRYFQILIKLYSWTEKYPTVTALFDRMLCSRRFPHKTATKLFDIIWKCLAFTYLKFIRHFYSRVGKLYQ
jgi:radical SAM superfamily enzyme YgiQ (UPF0313 family)